MAKNVKMAHIATELNVSVVTVSRALSGQKGVSPVMREQIKALAKEMGYRSPAQTKNKARESINIGILIPDKYLDKYESFYWKLYQEAAACALQNHCFTMLEILSHDVEKSCEAPRLIEEQKIDGLIILGAPGPSYLDFLEKKSPVPLLYLDFYDQNQQGDAVISDNYYGMYKMTNYLFDMGHDQIAFVGNLLSTSSITDRFFGYSKALLEHGQTVREDWIIDDRDEAEEIMKKVRRIILPLDMPTAFACNCDLSASKLIRALSEKGLRVPDDISVVGFDNYLYPGLCDIGITTYEVNTKEMVRKSIGLIINKISGADYKRGVTIIEGRPVYKESVRCRTRQMIYE